jgi:(R,R)-butanediol dehydrogenase/meso-butanediol dehydrogenase/diacetyl reductase
MVHPLPEKMTTEEGALIEPVAVGLHAVRRSGLRAGQTAIVFGAGPIGLVTILCLRAAGASLIAVTEVANARKVLAHEFGADLLLDPRTDDIDAAIAGLTGGVGFDTAFDAAGTHPTLDGALHAVRQGGTVVSIAMWTGPTSLHLNHFMRWEVNLTGSMAYVNEFPATIALMEKGRIDANGLISSRIRLEDVVSQGFEELINRKDTNVKILVSPAP